MNSTIRTIPETKLVGKRVTMTFADNNTPALWRSFMPRQKEIQNTIGTNLYSMQIYEASFFNNFSSSAEFEKWAAIEVSDFSTIPLGMETYTLPSGLYAVFLYKGAASEGAKAFEYIFGTWLPGSDYALDNRPHFEILGEKYKNNDPSSEEEIWIPIKAKQQYCPRIKSA